MIARSIAAALVLASSSFLASSAAAAEPEDPYSPSASDPPTTPSEPLAPLPVTLPPPSTPTPFTPAAPATSATSGAPMAPREPGPARPARRWYGWQTLLADGAVLVMLAASSALATGDHDSTSHALLYAALPGYALGGPIVHLANGRPGTAALDLAIRTLGPAIVGGLFYAATHDGSSYIDAGTLFGVFGAVAASCGAIAIDASVLARKPITEPKASWNIVPRVDIGQNRAGLTVGGTL